MSEKPAVLTDPARELAELLTVLQGGNPNLQGDVFLAGHFGVDAWSQDFLRIIATIMDRLIELKMIVAELDLDDDYRAEMVGHVEQVASAFSLHGFVNPWSAIGAKQVSPHNVQPIKGLSGMVRQRIAYRKLSDEDLIELAAMIDELTGWLSKHQLTEQDFIRQALLEGLQQLRFRLEKFKWLGWGYALDSLRQVIGAYMMLERQDLDPQVRPDAAAMLVKTGAAIKAVYEKMQVVKGMTETGDWLLKAYGTLALVHQAFPGISGLLLAR